ncbi:hypothetical protein [Sagittula sp. SSi028]|uniref:aldose epimerase family protein n=1 Tax=Sagittula sp. SSi028 TaxID=3400636 RepID=UPI003AF969E1
MAAQFLTFCAVLQDLRMAGADFSLALGRLELRPYLSNPNYLGVAIGRFANRINEGRTRIGDRLLSPDRNENGKYHLHGGRGSLAVSVLNAGGAFEDPCGVVRRAAGWVYRVRWQSGGFGSV